MKVTHACTYLVLVQLLFFFSASGSVIKSSGAKRAPPPIHPRSAKPKPIRPFYRSQSRKKVFGNVIDKEPEIVEEIVRVPVNAGVGGAASGGSGTAASVVTSAPRHSVAGLTRASMCSLELAEDLSGLGGDVGSLGGGPSKKQGPETFTTRYLIQFLLSRGVADAMPAATQFKPFQIFRPSKFFSAILSY